MAREAAGLDEMTMRDYLMFMICSYAPAHRYDPDPTRRP